MDKRMYVLKDKSMKERINPKEDDIVLYTKNLELTSKGFNNELLSVADDIVGRLELDPCDIWIIGDNPLVDIYIYALAEIYEVNVYHRDKKLPSFFIDVDFEDYVIWEEKLRDEIQINEYKHLPDQWRSVYYTDDYKARLSDVGRVFIERCKARAQSVR